MFRVIIIANANHQNRSQDDFHETLDEVSPRKRKCSGDPDADCVQEEAALKQEGKTFGDLRDCLLYQSCICMHKRIPSSFLMEYISNVKSYLFSLSSGSGEMDIGCSCSGTGIWSRINEMLLLHWQAEYNVGPYAWKHRFMCEVIPRKQAPNQTTFTKQTTLNHRRRSS